MRKRFIGTSCAAAVLSFAVAASAQATSQAPTQAPVQSGHEEPGATGTTGTQQPGSTTAGSRTDTTSRPGTQLRAGEGQMTLTGCIERGANSELVLMTSSNGSASPTGTSGSLSGGVAGSTSSSTTGTTSGSRAGTTATTAGAGGHDAAMYRLTGSQDLSRYVGQRVEVMGTLQAPTGNAGTPTTRGDNRSSANGSLSGNNGSAPGGGTTSSTTASASGAGDATASASAGSRDRDRDASSDRVERNPSPSTGNDTTASAGASVDPARTGERASTDADVHANGSTRTPDGVTGTAAGSVGTSGTTRSGSSASANGATQGLLVSSVRPTTGSCSK